MLCMYVESPKFEENLNKFTDREDFHIKRKEKVTIALKG